MELPQMSVPQMPVPQMPVPQMPVPQMPVPQMPVPQMSVPQMPVSVPQMVLAVILKLWYCMEFKCNDSFNSIEIKSVNMPIHNKLKKLK